MIWKLFHIQSIDFHNLRWGNDYLNRTFYHINKHQYLHVLGTEKFHNILDSSRRKTGRSMYKSRKFVKNIQIEIYKPLTRVKRFGYKRLSCDNERPLMCAYNYLNTKRNNCLKVK